MEFKRGRAACRPKAARWHAHVNAVSAVPAMQGWLSDPGSLTAKLVAHSRHFRVQRLRQRQALCLADELVVLRCDGNAMVYGHTVVPLSATAQQWPLFAGLGERSLGTTLFGDPQVERGELAYARLGSGHPLVQRIASLGLVEGWAEGHSSRRLFARRSVFHRKGGCLLVTEVFLPRIGDYFGVLPK
jgi:chorismate--pyruvate lyase